jgi:hypothetical protein
MLQALTQLCLWLYMLVHLHLLRQLHGCSCMPANSTMPAPSAADATAFCAGSACHDPATPDTCACCPACAATARTLELDVKLAADELVPLQDLPQATPAVLIFLLRARLAVGQCVVVVRFLQGRSCTSSIAKGSLGTRSSDDACTGWEETAGGSTVHQQDACQSSCSVPNWMHQQLQHKPAGYCKVRLCSPKALLFRHLCIYGCSRQLECKLPGNRAAAKSASPHGPCQATP